MILTSLNKFDLSKWIQGAGIFQPTSWDKTPPHEVLQFAPEKLRTPVGK